MTKVSVIIPSYNYGLYLHEAVDSVLNSSFQDVEIIVVDNGSTDEYTREVLRDFKKDKTTLILNEKNMGVSYARNQAIKHSTGEYILPLDADDMIHPDYIAKAVDILDANTSISIVYPEVEFFGEMEGWDIKPFDMRAMLTTNLIVVSGVYRRADYNKTKGYDEDLWEGFEDWDFWLSMLEQSVDVYRIPEKLFYYRLKKGSRNNSVDNEKIESIRKKVYSKHIELYNRYFPNPISLIEKSRYFEELCSEYKAVYGSREYLLGLKLLQPYRWFKKLLK